MPCTVLCLGAFLITTSCVHRSTFTMTFIKINKLEKSDNKNFVLLKAINSDFKKRINWDCSNCTYHDTHTLMRIVQKSAFAASTLETSKIPGKFRMRLLFVCQLAGFLLFS